MCYHRLTKSYLVLSKERKYLFCAYFCQTMKIPFKAIAALIILSLIGVFAYQAYWLTGLYTSMKKDMDNCLIETLQVSDYNEMMERCDSVKRSNETINGYIESSINLDSSALITKVIETEPFKQQKRFGLEINEPVSTTIDKKKKKKRYTGTAHQILPTGYPQPAGPFHGNQPAHFRQPFLQGHLPCAESSTCLTASK